MGVVLPDELAWAPDLIDLYPGTNGVGASSIERLGINPRFGNPPRAMDFGHGGGKVPRWTSAATR